LGGGKHATLSVWLWPDYSTFRFSDLKLSQTQVKPGDSIDVSFEVENTGDVAGDEVAQLYIHQRSGSASRPVRELKGFERITLPVHGKKTLHMSIGKQELRYWNAAKKDWVEEPAVFDIWIGGNSEASLHSSFEISQ
jgi:beta-glucosidase